MAQRWDFVEVGLYPMQILVVSIFLTSLYSFLCYKDTIQFNTLFLLLLLLLLAPKVKKINIMLCSIFKYKFYLKYYWNNHTSSFGVELFRLLLISWNNLFSWPLCNLCLICSSCFLDVTTACQYYDYSEVDKLVVWMTRTKNIMCLVY